MCVILNNSYVHYDKYIYRKSIILNIVPAHPFNVFTKRSTASKLIVIC